MVAQNATKWSLKHLDYSTIYNTICIIMFRLLDNIEWVGFLNQTIILSCGFKKLVELQGSNEDISPIMFWETCHDIVRLYSFIIFVLNVHHSTIWQFLGCAPRTLVGSTWSTNKLVPNSHVFKQSWSKQLWTMLMSPNNPKWMITTLHDKFMPCLKESCTSKCSIYFYKLPYATCLQRLWIWIPCHLTLWLISLLLVGIVAWAWPIPFNCGRNMSVQWECQV
jgi:hypothetical protein